MQDYDNEIKIADITYFKMTDAEFSDPCYKNELISRCNSDYIIFINTRYTNVEEVEQIINENPFLMNYDLIIFGENILQDEIYFNMLINCFNMRPYAMIVRKSILSASGCFNEQLKAMDIYELALRIAYEQCNEESCLEYEHYNDKPSKVYGVVCQKYIGDEKTENDMIGTFNDKKHESVSVEMNHNMILTYAYVLRKYMYTLKKINMLENVLDNMTYYAIKADCENIFNSYVNDFLNNSQLYKKIEMNTAPFYIIMGDNICYGVLKRFAISLTEELICNGQAVITSDGSYGKKAGLEYVEKQVLKGIIGFQAPVLFKEYFRKIKVPKYIFWFDHPIYFKDILEKTNDSYYLLCQDKYYAEFMRKYYNIENAIQFSPAGESANFINNKNREYDIVFIGSYHMLGDWVIQDEFQMKYYNYMMYNPEYTFEQGLENVLKKEKINIDEEKFFEVLYSLQNVCRKIVYDYRIKVIEAIIKSGIKIDVFGDTWKKYDGGYKDNLIIHSEVSVDEALKIWGHSKIGLNIMTWHKAGMTERIANICLSGAVCLTDSSEYLSENFNNNENIIVFDLNRLEELPKLINKVLSDNDLRQKIADNAYMVANKKHTWKVRTKEFLCMINNKIYK